MPTIGAPELFVIGLTVVVGVMILIRHRAQKRGNNLQALGLYLGIVAVILIGGWVLLAFWADELDQRERRERFGPVSYLSDEAPPPDFVVSADAG